MKRSVLILFLLGFAARAITPTPSPSPTPFWSPTPSPSPTPDISVMVARIKAAKAANKPFTILYSGGQVTVAGGNYIALNPSGKFTNIVVFTADDTTNMIPVLLITGLVLVTNYPFD
jgi:hypothetical protein